MNCSEVTVETGFNGNELRFFGDSSKRYLFTTILKHLAIVGTLQAFV